MPTISWVNPPDSCAWVASGKPASARSARSPVAGRWTVATPLKLARQLEAAGAPIEWDRQEAGLTAAEHGHDLLPQETLDSIERNRFCLKGPLTTPIGAGFRSINVALRKHFDLYANVRPTRFRPGYRSPLAHPEGIDLVIVRENLEDLYLFLEGEVEDLAPLDLVSPTARQRVAEMGPGRYVLKVITEATSFRVCRFVF